MFADDGVKDACEKHDVYYLNPGVVWSSSDHEANIARLAREDTDFDVVEQKRLNDGPTRKAVYLPKREWEREDEDDDGPDVARQELLEEFSNVGDVDPLLENRDGDPPLGNPSRRYARRGKDQGAGAGRSADGALETNLLWVDADPDDVREMKHQNGRLMARYKRRWGIENGFKKLKTFPGETQSLDPRFRYFNFSPACSTTAGVSWTSWSSWNWTVRSATSRRSRRTRF